MTGHRTRYITAIASERNRVGWTWCCTHDRTWCFNRWRNWRHNGRRCCNNRHAETRRCAGGGRRHGKHRRWRNSTRALSRTRLDTRRKSRRWRHGDCRWNRLSSETNCQRRQRLRLDVAHARQPAQRHAMHQQRNPDSQPQPAARVVVSSIIGVAPEEGQRQLKRSGKRAHHGSVHARYGKAFSAR